MARRQSPSSAGDGPSLPAPRHVEEAALREAVASLAALDLAGLRVQWRNVFRGVELASAMGARGTLEGEQDRASASPLFLEREPKSTTSSRC